MVVVVVMFGRKGDGRNYKLGRQGALLGCRTRVFETEEKWAQQAQKIQTECLW